MKIRLQRIKISTLIIAAVLTLSSIYSCKPSMDEQVSKRYDEVMAIHDEVMPLMSTTSKLRRQIKKHNHNNAADQLIADLNASDEYMMDWMREFKIPKDLPVSEQMKFLDTMEKKAEKMKQMFDKSIVNATNYTKSHQH